MEALFLLVPLSVMLVAFALWIFFGLCGALNAAVRRHDPTFRVGVRLAALQALKPYVKEDMRVRDAMLEALMGDTNPGVRTQALGVIRQVKQDASVRAVLMQLAEKDSNNFIKNESKRILAQAPEMD